MRCSHGVNAYNSFIRMPISAKASHQSQRRKRGQETPGVSNLLIGVSGGLRGEDNNCVNFCPNSTGSTGGCEARRSAKTDFARVDSFAPMQASSTMPKVTSDGSIGAALHTPVALREPNKTLATHGEIND